MGDARLWLGIALVAGSVTVGAVVMTADRDTVTVLRASRDLSVGAVPEGLEPVALSRLAAGDAYLTGEPPVDAVLRWPVRAGELLPAAALVSPEPQQHRQVTVAVDPLHAPIDVRPGDRVDVWSSPGSSSRGAVPPRQVVAEARIASVSADPVGVGGEIAVVLDLPPDDVQAVVEAVRTGDVDLVAVPVDSQAVATVNS